MSKPFNRRPPLLAALLAGLIACTLPAAAQVDRAGEEAIKAGFIYNFVKYTEWPRDGRDDETTPLRICATAANPLDGRLTQLQDRLLQNRPIVVHTGVRAAQWASCHVLFISTDEAGRSDTVLRVLGNAAVLTISDLPDFAQAGGMIGLRETDNRIRFEVNLAAAQRAGLRMSSQMLKLASRVLQ
jgi:hypothetical protein